MVGPGARRRVPSGASPPVLLPESLGRPAPPGSQPLRWARRSMVVLRLGRSPVGNVSLQSGVPER